MSRDFIKLGVNKSSVDKAARQERQLAYFTQSQIQEDRITSEYIKLWAERKYDSSDYFLNFVKSIFKTENFLNFFKYMRYPLPSAKIINNKIKPHLKRVFVAENADFKYDVTNVTPEDVKDTLDIKSFEEELFRRVLFNHNSIIVEDLDPEKPNIPFRYFLDVERVTSIEMDRDGNIERLAFKAAMDKEPVIVYVDDEQYIVYDKELEVKAGPAAHDLGRCPATFIVHSPLKDDPIVKESIFSYIREELEEYVFLKTLQKMTDPNGAFPVITKIESTDDTDLRDDSRGEEGEPSASNIMGSQTSQIHGDAIGGQTGDMQPGTVHEVPLGSITDSDGKVNADAVKNYLNFFYVPPEVLSYIAERVTGIEDSIQTTIIGSRDLSNEESKNEMQIEKSIITLENTLITIADTLNRARKSSDYNMLALRYSPAKVNEVFIFYGTDFFLDSQRQLFEDLAKAPNPIERRNILKRINQNKYKNNRDQMARQDLLYDLLPFTSDTDFEIARGAGLDPLTGAYQLRFNYWIGVFEAIYGDIVSFYTGYESEDKAVKLMIINNLIIDIIKENTTETQIEEL